jgi:hypothetical protein
LQRVSRPGLLVNMQGAAVRTYIPEKKQKGQGHWDGRREQQQAVYANRRQVKETRY